MRVRLWFRCDFQHLCVVNKVIHYGEIAEQQGSHESSPDLEQNIGGLASLAFAAIRLSRNL